MHIKKYKDLITIFLIYILYLLLITTLSYYKVINFSYIPSISLIFGCLITMALGIRLGKKREKKAYIGGLKLGFIIITILLGINLIFFRLFTLKTLIYYVIILLSSIMGSIIGINKKK